MCLYKKSSKPLLIGLKIVEDPESYRKINIIMMSDHVNNEETLGKLGKRTVRIRKGNLDVIEHIVG